MRTLSLRLSRRGLLSATAAAVFAPAIITRAHAAAAPALLPVVGGLDHPWGLAFLPDGRGLVTERAGRLRVFDPVKRELKAPVTGTPDVAAEGQGGLLGIALDPAFNENRRIYLAFAEPREGGSSTSVFRGRMSEDATSITEGAVIFRQNPAVPSRQHFGSRLVFDREGHLFVTTGDRGRFRDQSQDPASHIGKIIRITTDGAPAPGNPTLPGWAPEIWSMGHRNVQAAALDPATGALMTVEHGAQGGDELNMPLAGRNYGWPVISYGREYGGGEIGSGTAQEGMEQPLHYWDPSIAPSGLAFYTGDAFPAWKGSLFVGALAGQHIARLTLKDNKVASEERLFDGTARFRDVVQGPNGSLFALTDAAEPEGAVMQIVGGQELTGTIAQ